MNKTKEGSTLKITTSITEKNILSVEDVTVFYISIAVMLDRLNIGVSIATINSENDKMIKFGIDPVKLKAFFDFYNLNGKKALSKKEKEEFQKKLEEFKEDAKELKLVCYRYLLYLVVRGVSIIGWLDQIFPDSANGIFKKTAWDAAILKQMKDLKSLVVCALKKDSLMRYQEIPFDTAMHAWSVRFKQEYPVTADILDVKKISLNDLNKFLECFIQDCDELIMK